MQLWSFTQALSYTKKLIAACKNVWPHISLFLYKEAYNHAQKLIITLRSLEEQQNFKNIH